MVFDFGSGIKFLIDADEYGGASMMGAEVLAVVDDLRGKEASDLVIEYLSRGVLGDGIYLPSTVPRQSVKTAVFSVLDGLFGDREGFAGSIEYEGPIDTDSDKAARVDYYVDTAVSFED